MPARPEKRRSFRHVVNCDLELRPLMNVFIVLIPMLLMSAVFIEIRVIEMSLPEAAQAAEQTPPAESLDLVIRLLPDAYVVEGRGMEPLSIPIAWAPAAGGAAARAARHPLTEALARIVADHPGSREVRIVVGAATRYQAIVTAMDLARAAGLTQVALEGPEENAR
jgi:biopolymer transport protein ExbD